MENPQSSLASDTNESTLDRNSDTKGLVDEVQNTTDWTDVVHSKRKKRDRLLDDRIIIMLSQKSDVEGFKRLLTNILILITTAKCIDWIWMLDYGSMYMKCFKMSLFLPMYAFYGFQIQCFGYAAQHEMMHRTAFRSRWLNDLFLFLVSIPCIEFGKHEKAMHKQHHTYTNNIYKDPELTSFWSREELEKPGFRKVSCNRTDYLMEFVDLYSIMKSHIMRIVNSARGRAVDYSGVRWSLKEWIYDDEVLLDLKHSAQLQLLVYIVIFVWLGKTLEGRHMLFFYWLLPAVIGFVPINFVRNAEHAACEISTSMNCLRNTRSVQSNYIVRQLMWNMNLHAEHHLYPMIPFFNLPKLSEHLRSSLEHNDIASFTKVNIEYTKIGGWIDQQKNEIPYSRKAD